MSYQWSRNGQPLSNGGGVSGVNSPNLTINPATEAHAGLYSVSVSNSCGNTSSEEATLTVLCYANCDNSTGLPRLTANDFQCFVNAFASALPYANCDGSTGNPALTANDFQCFINRYASGCP